MLRTIERPTNTTLRPYLWAASTTCCTRCTWLEKLATMILRVALGERLVQRRADRGLRLHEPGNLGVRRIHHQQVHALFAELAELHQIGDAVVERQLVELDVAGVDERVRPACCTHTASASGIECVTEHELEVERTHLQLVTALRPATSRRLDAVLPALRLHESRA